MSLPPPIDGPPLLPGGDGGANPRQGVPTSIPVGRTPSTGSTAPAAGLLPLATSDAEATSLAEYQIPGWGSSLIVHMLMIIALGLMIPWSEPESQPPVIVASFETPGDDDTPLQMLDAAVQMENSAMMALPVAEQMASLSVQYPGEPAEQQTVVATNSLGFEAALPHELMRRVGGRGGHAWDGRSPNRRMQAALHGGGTRESEAAVERGLRWLAAHQLRDGSWRFNHHTGLCQGQCRNPGSASASTASTALGLLPFLGAGYTQFSGEYQSVVQRGLDYLTSRALTTPLGVDLQEGTMYAQGLATMALCEAYGLTQDARLKEPAQAALDFIVRAQHAAGGWRYAPGQPGDTTVTGWQVMALKSGQMAYLKVPQGTLEGVGRFLTSVQADGGAMYGYQGPGSEPTTSSVGLLLRLYGGWTDERPAMIRGVSHISEDGPSEDNMYFNYYATQVLHHTGGPNWDPWNHQMREMLVRTQASRGHESGSWYFAGGRCDVGGRLLGTSLALLTLEVYYRYLPLYRTMATDPDF